MNLDSLNNLTAIECSDQGLQYLDNNNLNAGLDMLNLALEKDPTLLIAKMHRSRAYNDLKMHDLALNDIDEVIKQQPKNSTARFYKGNILSELKKREEAIIEYNISLINKPNTPEVLSNRAIQHSECNRLNNAETDFKTALKALKHPEIHHNYARLLWQMNRYEDAMQQCKNALAISDHPHYRFTLGLQQLTIGNFKEGWKNYESRINSNFWRQKNFKPWTNNIWLMNGQTLNDKTVLVYNEQGAGDVIQFIRYAKVLKKECKVLLVVPSNMATLLQSFDDEIEMYHSDVTLPYFHHSCPYMSLPYYFKSNESNIPVEIPYITPTITQDFMIDKTKINIGIAWSGSTTHEFDALRSIPLNKLQPILDLPIEFHSLHIEMSDDDKEYFNTTNINDYRSKISNYNDTAQLIQEMDLIVSVDTSVVHLAGAMGKPVWILLPFSPDWRWLNTGNTTPWYPTALLFRQKKRFDWEPIIENVKQQLIERFKIDKTT